MVYGKGKEMGFPGGIIGNETKGLVLWPVICPPLEKE